MPIFFTLRARRHGHNVYRLNEEITPGRGAQIFPLRGCAISRPSETVTADYSLASVRVCSPIFRLDKYYTSLGMKLLRLRSRQLIKCIADSRGKDKSYDTLE